MNQKDAYTEIVENEKFFKQIWDEFLRLLIREINHSSQADVARRLGVNRGQVSKWLSGMQVGGNLKTFITHAQRLGFDWTKVVNGEPVPENTEFDNALLETLRATMAVLGVKNEKILPEDRTTPLNTQELHQVCQSLKIEPGMPLRRAAELADAKAAAEPEEAKRTA